MSCSVSQTYIEIGFSQKKKRTQQFFFYVRFMLRKSGFYWPFKKFKTFITKNWSNICRSFGADLTPVFHLLSLLANMFRRRVEGRKRGEGVLQDNSTDQLNEKQIFRKISPSNAACQCYRYNTQNQFSQRQNRVLSLLYYCFKKDFLRRV